MIISKEKSILIHIYSYNSRRPKVVRGGEDCWMVLTFVQLTMEGFSSGLTVSRARAILVSWSWGWNQQDGRLKCWVRWPIVQVTVNPVGPLWDGEANDSLCSDDVADFCRNGANRCISSTLWGFKHLGLCRWSQLPSIAPPVLIYTIPAQWVGCVLVLCCSFLHYYFNFFVLFLPFLPFILLYLISLSLLLFC